MSEEENVPLYEYEITMQDQFGAETGRIVRIKGHYIYIEKAGDLTVLNVYRFMNDNDPMPVAAFRNWCHCVIREESIPNLSPAS